MFVLGEIYFTTFFKIELTVVIQFTPRFQLYLRK